MKIVELLWLMLQLLVGYNLIFPVMLLLIYNLRKQSRNREQNHVVTRVPDYGIIVTATAFGCKFTAEPELRPLSYLCRS
jgi:hypothetical protein